VHSEVAAERPHDRALAVLVDAVRAVVAAAAAVRRRW